MSCKYKDALAEITDDAIVFHRFYFPSGRDKMVALNDVESVETHPASVSAGRWRLWGSGDLRTWFPEDYRRPARDCIFRVRLRRREPRPGLARRVAGLLTGESYLNIGFTVEDSRAVIKILREMKLLAAT
jgi:hypothetical protein